MVFTVLLPGLMQWAYHCCLPLLSSNCVKYDRWVFHHQQTAALSCKIMKKLLFLRHLHPRETNVSLGRKNDPMTLVSVPFIKRILWLGSPIYTPRDVSWIEVPLYDHVNSNWKQRLMFLTLQQLCWYFLQVSLATEGYLAVYPGKIAVKLKD